MGIITIQVIKKHILVSKIVPGMFPIFFSDRNSTTCDLMTANLSCPNGTFINLNTVFYGHDVEVNMTCNVTGVINGSCIPSADMEGHNSAQVYERCQMRQNCTFMVSNDTFRDPCPGITKHLKIKYSCSPGKDMS